MKKEVVLVFIGLLLIFLGLFLFQLNITGSFILGNPVSGDISSFVSRSFEMPEYVAGVEMKVDLKVNVNPSDKIINYGVEEYVPSGWDVSLSSISHGGYYNQNLRRISWIINSSSSSSYLNAVNLSYKITPISASGVQIFKGNSSFTDVYSNVLTFNISSIFGENQINEAPIGSSQVELYINQLVSSAFVSGDKMSTKVKVISPSNLGYDCIANFSYGVATIYSGNCTNPILVDEGSVVSIKAYNDKYGSVDANVSGMSICESSSFDSSGITCNITMNANKFINATFSPVNKVSCNPVSLSIVNNNNGNYVLSWPSQIDCGYMVQSSSSPFGPFLNYTQYPLYSSSGSLLTQAVVGVSTSQYFRLLITVCKSGVCAPALIPALSLSISPSLTISEGTSVSAIGGGCPSGVSCYLIKDNYVVNNPDSSTLSLGTHEYVYTTNGNSVYSASNTRKSVSVISAPIVPNAPSNLIIKNNGNLALRLDWKDNSNNEEGFVIQRKTSATGSYSQIAIVPAGTNYYVNTGLTNKQSYSYIIYAYNQNGSSLYSNEVSATAYNCNFLKKLFGSC